MQYPWWYVPGLTSPMLIAIIAVLHVVVSHYAVGGGIILARENAYALKKNEKEYRAYWKKHLKFFVLLTVVYGAVTGVGIWWMIGLASPLATEILIRTFVFGWAIEWVSFIIEIVAAFGFYYFWDQMSAKAHAKIGWIYALAAWVSLVLISGITAFMLNSQSMLGPENADPLASFWHAFFNVQFLPQAVARTGGALVLATCYIYLHAAMTEKEEIIREQIVRRMRVPSLIGIILMAGSLPVCFYFLPQSALMMVERAAAINIFVGIFAGTLLCSLLLLWVGPFRAPDKMGAGLALALFLFGGAALATGEFIREAVRKPFIVDQIVYANQVIPEQVISLRQKGLLQSGVWTKKKLVDLQKKYPSLKLLAENESNNPDHTAFSSVRQTGYSDNQYLPAEPLPLVGESDQSGHSGLSEKKNLAGRSNVIKLVQNETSAFTPTSTPPPVPLPLSNSAPDSGSLPNAGNVLPSENIPPSNPNSAPAPARASASSGNPALPPASAGHADPHSGAFEDLPPLPPKKRTILARSLKLDESSIAPGNTDLLKIKKEDQLELGRMIFMHHCNDCHSEKHGYSAVAPLLTGRKLEEIRYLLIHLNRPGYFMPPWCGTQTEADLLAGYLLSISPEMPDNIVPRPKKAPNPSAASSKVKEKKNKVESESKTEQKTNVESIPVPLPALPQ